KNYSPRPCAVCGKLFEPSRYEHLVCSAACWKHRQLERCRLYWKTPKYKAMARRYRQSDAGKEAHQAYNQSPKGQETNSRYRLSPEYKRRVKLRKGRQRMNEQLEKIEALIRESQCQNPKSY